ncbi:MAG: heat shock protein transcriptional repressor HspR [Gaiellales bacterium]
MSTPSIAPRYSISVAAELSGLHPQTLRVYEAKGLVRPRRTPGGTRRYSDADIARLVKVATLTSELGLNLAGVLQVMALEDTVDRLSHRIAELEGQLFEAARQMRAEVAQVHRTYRRDLGPYQPPKHPEAWTFRNSQ